MKAQYPSWEKDYQRRYRASLSPEVKAARLAKARQWAKDNDAHRKSWKRTVSKFRENPEIYAAYLKKRRDYYHKNKVSIQEKHKAYSARNRDKILAHKREYYRKNFEHFSEYNRKRYASNPEFFIQKAAEWAKNNRLRVLEARRNLYHSDTPSGRHRRAKHKEYAIKRWREKPDVIRAETKAWKQKQKEQVTDFYARQILAKRSNLTPNEFPQELVELKKAELRLKQELQKQQN